jgi:hypothetical protein
MPASTFYLRPREGSDLWKRMKAWIEKHPRGTTLTVKGRALEVTEASCSSVRMGIANYREVCEVEMRDKQTGGLANFNIDFTEEGSPRGRGHPLSEFEMIDADFPYPLEFDIAKEEFGIRWTPRTAQCFEMGDMRYCPAIQVIGGGLAAQEEIEAREYLKRLRETGEELPRRGTGILRRTARRRDYPPLSDEEREERHKRLFGQVKKN